MKVIGLCGGSGSGKGAVSDILRGFGIAIIDTDRVYHEITSRPSECLSALAEEFGAEVIRDGALDRARLREIVVEPAHSSTRLLRLNSITHKYVIAETERLVLFYRENGAKGVVIDAPLLFESGLDDRCDTVIAVIANREVRLARIMLRDGLSLDAARKRIEAQIPDARLCEMVDHVICNDGTIDELYSEVRRVHNKIFDI